MQCEHEEQLKTLQAIKEILEPAMLDCIYLSDGNIKIYIPELLFQSLEAHLDSIASRDTI